MHVDHQQNVTLLNTHDGHPKTPFTIYRTLNQPNPNKGPKHHERHKAKAEPQQKPKWASTVNYQFFWRLMFYLISWLLLRAYYRGDWQWVEEGIGILKRESATIHQGLAIVHKAIIIAKALEDLWVDEMSRAEPATVEVNAIDVAPGYTHVHDLNGVGGNATWEWACRSLVYHYIWLGTLFTPNSVWFLHCYCCVKHIQTNINNRGGLRNK